MLLVAAATPAELRAALNAFGPLPDMEQGTAQAVNADRTALLALPTGVGMLNAALAMGRILEQRGVSGVLGLGLAGSFDLDELPLGTICAVRRETWPEYGLGLEGDAGADARALGFPLARVDDADVWNSLDLDPDAAARAMGLRLPGSWPRSTSLTVNTVSATPARAERLRGAHGAQLENMEGFALAYACALARVPFLEIRSVSNLVGSRKPHHWKLQQGLEALGNAVQTLLGAAGRQGK